MPDTDRIIRKQWTEPTSIADARERMALLQERIQGIQTQLGMSFLAYRERSESPVTPVAWEQWRHRAKAALAQVNSEYAFVRDWLRSQSQREHADRETHRAAGNTRRAARWLTTRENPSVLLRLAVARVNLLVDVFVSAQQYVTERTNENFATMQHAVAVVEKYINFEPETSLPG